MFRLDVWFVGPSSVPKGVNDFREDLKRMMTEVTKGEGKARAGAGASLYQFITGW